MDAQTTIQLEKDHVLHTYNRPDFVITHGEGSWLYDHTGRQYLDAVSGIAVTALGHADPDVVQAIQEASTQPLHLSNLYHNAPMSHLAAELCQSCFADRIFFCNSGAEANEGAFKFARKYARQVLGHSDKTEIVAFSGSFHGRTFGSLSATATEKYRLPFEPLVPGFRFAPFNDIEAATAAITERTCAVIVEPIQGEGGVTPATPEFLAALRQRCDAVEALLIVDEVQCGLGRSGELWAHQLYQLEPDMMTVAKPLAGGLPMGGILLTNKVAQAISPGDHGSTFAGGPFISHVARTVLRKISHPAFMTSVRVKSDKLATGLCHLAEKSDHITTVRGRGMMWGLVTTVPAIDIMKAAYDYGLFILVAGPNVVRLLPPLSISDSEIDYLLTQLTAVFEDYQPQQAEASQ